MPVPYQILLA